MAATLASIVQEREGDRDRLNLPRVPRPPAAELSVDLEPRMPEANVGLGRYIADELWPRWAAAIVEQSRDMAEKETDRLRIANVPMGA